MTCPLGHTNITLVEYDYDNPYRYDGISEIHCDTCKKRYGRWSKKELKGKQQEPPYGDKKNITKSSKHYNQ